MTNIYVSGNYFYIKLSDNVIPLSDNKPYVEVYLVDVDTSSYRIRSPLIGDHVFLLADILDESNIAYSSIRWIDFFENNTGGASAPGVDVLNGIPIEYDKTSGDRGF